MRLGISKSGVLMAALAAILTFVPMTQSRAAEPQIRDIDIRVSLTGDGAAEIVEDWDVTVTSGTEWYLVRYNLGDIVIRDLRVSEDGVEFDNIGDWDVHASMAKKAGRCGINRVSEGDELCWGVGSYGDHRFRVSYRMDNAVKSLNDYDMLHLQLVSPGLSSRPWHARVTIEIPGTRLDSANARIWGFGYEGTMLFEDGRIVAQTSGRMSSDASIIALVRLDKGLVHPSSVRERDFEYILDMALDGADFGDMVSEPGLGELIAAALCVLMFILLIVFVIIAYQRNKAKTRMEYLGTSKLKSIGWSREVPYGGSIVASDFVLGQLGMRRVNSCVASAMILRMVQHGALILGKDKKGRVEIAFGDEAHAASLGVCEAQLYHMMKDASGADMILQDKEFGRWSKAHAKRVSRWLDTIEAQGREELSRLGLKIAGRCTDECRQNGRMLLGLRQFLKEFTLIKERLSGEVVLWEDYMVFAALFGIADKVAEELKDINPKALEESSFQCDYMTMRSIIYLTDNLASSITSAKAAYDASKLSSSGAKGLGGGASFGGGGGFSGGGFGGGSR